MKMKIIYKPDAADRQEWVVDRGNPAWDVSYPVEKATDWGWLEFLQRMDAMSSIAWRALLWALRKQNELRLPLEAVEIDWTQIDFLVLCPGCEAWVAPQGHDCDLSALVVEEPDAEPEVEAPKAGEKSADPKP